MQRWRGLEAAPPGWGRCVLTIGVFDGVHRGHQLIISRAVERSRAAGLPSLVLSFDPHPSEVVRPGSHPAVLTTARYKAELLEQLGVDVFCVLPFTAEFSRLAPDEFVHAALVEQLHAAAVVVGENFRFGHKAAGDLGTLRDLGGRWGFATEGVPLLPEAGHAISSTYVRSCVDAGDVTAAAAALGRPHRVEGVVVRGDRRGRTIGYPTANVEPAQHAAIPADGVYAGHLVRRSTDVAARLPAAISIGTNPTFAGRERRVEAYVLPAEPAGLSADAVQPPGPTPGLDLYGEHVGLDIEVRLRPTLRFDAVPDLVEQMARDVAETRRVLSLP